MIAGSACIWAVKPCALLGGVVYIGWTERHLRFGREVVRTRTEESERVQSGECGMIGAWNGRSDVMESHQEKMLL